MRVRSVFTGEIGHLLSTRQDLPEDPQLGLVRWAPDISSWHRMSDLEEMPVEARVESSEVRKIDASTRHLRDVLARNLTRLRAARKLTQAELSKLAGLSTDQLQNAEMGRRSTPLESFAKLCAALEVTPSDLLDGL